TLMSEGRKYGSCIICGLQSLNQLYSLYGQYEGSSIFGQFGTNFFFRNTESLVAKQISDISGMETITRQQKNTSFGANEFRDGISYNEHQQKKPLIEPSDLSSLATGSCYVFLPEPDVRMAKIAVPYNNIANRQDGFLPKIESPKSGEDNSDTDNEDSSKNNKSKTTNAGARKTKSTNRKEDSSKQKKRSIDDGKKENKASNKNAGIIKDKSPHERSKPKRRVTQKKKDIKTNSDNKLINNV
ncbi:MAG: type IV secretion system DNA-binding domain-containing protein, partial [Rickettsiaceae bacterium]|nr:type IV secretion system DNA-binding domain-containing protein [Rickettsiaceae bacterium]